MASEVEIKFRVDEIHALERLLRKLGFRRITPRTREMNVLYDRQGALRRRGEVLRIRKYGDDWTLTHKSKGKVGRHKVREELETAIQDGDALHRMFGSLGFEPAFRYEKFRSEWSDGTGHAVIDETPIGDLAELEGPARWIDGTARSLGITPGEYITQSY